MHSYQRFIDIEITSAIITNIIFYMSFHIFELLSPASRIRCRIYSGFHFLLAHWVLHLNTLMIKCDINQQDLKRVDFHFVKSE